MLKHPSSDAKCLRITKKQWNSPMLLRCIQDQAHQCKVSLLQVVFSGWDFASTTYSWRGPTSWHLHQATWCYDFCQASQFNNGLVIKMNWNEGVWQYTYLSMGIPPDFYRLCQPKNERVSACTFTLSKCDMAHPAHLFWYALHAILAWITPWICSRGLTTANCLFT